MKSLLVFSILFLLSLNSQANLLQINPSQNNPQIVKFLNDVESKLPNKMKQALQAKGRTITVTFDKLKNDSNVIQVPNCENVVDSFLEAKKVISEYQSASKSVRGKSLRYNKQIYSYADSRGQNITMNVGFMPIVIAGESVAQKYNCEHKNLYRLAQGSLINALAAIYDSTQSVVIRNGNKTTRTDGVSDSLRYMTIAGWSKKEKLQYGFWPRAINPFEYAGGPDSHFALNMEFFLLDPEYACRRPLIQDFLERHFAENGQKYDPLATQRNCKVNYVLKIPQRNALLRKTAKEVNETDIEQTLRSYDLSPDKVFNVNYLRAGASSGAGSFGHAMFKFESCAPDQPLSSKCDSESFSLVINPRANPLEMRLDNIRGFFGGYPSMFLVTPIREITEEYNQRELRHLYNVPLTGAKVTDPATGQIVDVLPEDQKVRFIQATLDQYWNYYGNYKFISNNCADEAMRLYQMSSENPQVLEMNILMPQQFNQKLSRLGLADEAKTKGLEPAHGLVRKLLSSIFKKDMKWEQFKALYQQAEDSGDDSTHLSFNYDIMDSVRNIMIAEGQSPKKYNSTKALTKESKKWIKIAIPQIDLDDAELENFRQTGSFSEAEQQKVLQNLNELIQRYNTLMAQSQSVEQKRQIALNFYRLTHLIITKRRDAIGNDAVRLAYAIAYPKKEKTDVTSRIDPEQLATIKNAVDKYAEIQQSLMPYRELSTKPGYGIPLESEVTRGYEFALNVHAEHKLMEELIVALKGLLGTDYLIRKNLKEFQKQIIIDKTNLD